jgi:glycosyltransferase involved in cell wall biosynthesis
MKKPLLSVIVPVYNAEKSVGRLIKRILSQPMTDLELILVNDGSSDGSLAVLKRFSSDKRVKIINQKNGGASVARNCGIDRASGRYVMFIDADDDIHPKMIVKMVNYISQKKLDLVTSGAKLICYQNGRLRTITEIGITRLARRSKNQSFTSYIVNLIGNDSRLYNTWNKIYRIELIRKYRIYFQAGLDFGEDLTFNLHYLKHVRAIDFIYEPLYYYNSDTATGTFGKSSLVYENRLKNYGALLDFVGQKSSHSLDDLLGWIKYYWFYSYALAVCSAKLSRDQRLALLQDGINREKFPKIGHRRHIGRKKQFIEWLIRQVSRSPGSLSAFMTISSHLKNNLVLARVWRKLAQTMLSNSRSR